MTLTEEVELATVTVTPVAEGVSLTPSRSYGYENTIIELNLNASMKDPDAAKSTQADSSTETTTIVITGLGEHAEFYVGGTGSWSSLYTQTTWDPSTGSYTITGLSQDQLNSLGFKQAISAITDQNTSKAGTQIRVELYTQEDEPSVAPSASTFADVDLTLWAQYATNTHDVLLWTGEKINGYAGNDTVQLRFGENLTGAELSAKLKNIEVIDLGVAGANEITGLTAADVFKMTDANNRLSILGDAEDHVNLGAGWTQNNNVYTATHSGQEITLTIGANIVID